MNNESKQASTHLSKEFVFWFHIIRRKLAYYFPWDTPQQLVRVVVNNSHVRSDGIIWTNSQDILNISLQDIVQTKLTISTGHIGTLEILTSEPKHYVLLPTNPFDPTLLSHSNVDEIMAFISVVKALKTNRPPDFDENPYRRQFQKNNQPAYLNSKIDLLWDKDVSPWEYYYQFVPDGLDKKKRDTANVYKIIVLGVLSIMILVALYAMYVKFVW